MIARLRGKLIDRGGDWIIVDCNGVGYEVVVSAVTAAELPAVGDDLALRVHTHAQENRIALFGFLGEPEQALFDLLITVKNVGPTTAIGILSGGASPAALARAIAEGDRARLTKIKGVGKKTAEMCIAELREKCELLLATWGAGGVPIERSAAPAAPDRRSKPRDERLEAVASALVNLGWRAVEAERAIGQLTDLEGATLESLLRQALRLMPR